MLIDLAPQFHLGKRRPSQAVSKISYRIELGSDCGSPIDIDKAPHPRTSI